LIIRIKSHVSNIFIENEELQKNQNKLNGETNSTELSLRSHQRSARKTGTEIQTTEQKRSWTLEENMR
jgi:hypothetical protein